MEPLSSLHLLAEAVRNAGADIAPTYQEYIQLAFAIATDCGEAGRHDFKSVQPVVQVRPTGSRQALQQCPEDRP